MLPSVAGPELSVSVGCLAAGTRCSAWMAIMHGHTTGCDVQADASQHKAYVSFLYHARLPSMLAPARISFVLGKAVALS